jgi:hypothetical protein
MSGEFVIVFINAIAIPFTFIADLASVYSGRLSSQNLLTCSISAGSKVI